MSSSSISTSSSKAHQADGSGSSDPSLGELQILNLPYRVMTPPRRAPLISNPDDDGCRVVRRLFGDEFETAALEFAVKAGVVDVISSLTARETKGADEIDIGVEMIAADLVRRKYLSLLDENDPTYRPLKEAWPFIKDSVVDILESSPSTAGHLASIALFKLGFSSDPDDNPITVYVALEYESPATGWSPVENAIRSFLGRYHFGLKLQMEHNSTGHRAAFPLIGTKLTPSQTAHRVRQLNYGFWKEYSEQVDAGADIGVGSYLTRVGGQQVCPLAGTLGCWLEVHVRDKGWTPVALTNYHVVRPALEGFRVDVEKPQRADTKGLIPKDAAHLPQVEHPTRSRHNFTVEESRRSLLPQGRYGDPTPKHERMAQTLNQQVAFFDEGKQYFGEIWFASGFLQRTKHKGRLDWALIKPLSEARVGENRLPSENDWNQMYQYFGEWPSDETFGAILGPPANLSLFEMKEGSPVFKIGASTRMTRGIISEIKPDCVIKEEKYLHGRRRHAGSLELTTKLAGFCFTGLLTLHGTVD
ncbi:hypothetical protein VTJ49DRAFT_557 [Mycothermus thermophilus]|uniref:Uncharacterized protein n=1 Tax=Humicola insolens TaxID=85995 RepID=A0ABR3VF81_HUMIN